MLQKLDQFEDSHGFSILSNDCVAWAMYKQLKMRYTTPTIGLFFWSEDYIKFLESFPLCLLLKLTFVEKSQHSTINDWRKTNKWPIGLLNGFEIQFLHYKSKQDAIDAWERRKVRIDYKHLFVVYSNHYGFTEDHFERFERLPFTNKLFLSTIPRSEPFVLHVPEFEGMLANRFYEKYMDVEKWLNNEPDWRKQC